MRKMSPQTSPGQKCTTALKKWSIGAPRGGPRAPDPARRRAPARETARAARRNRENRENRETGNSGNRENREIGKSGNRENAQICAELGNGENEGEKCREIELKRLENGNIENREIGHNRRLRAFRDLKKMKWGLTVHKKSKKWGGRTRALSARHQFVPKDS